MQNHACLLFSHIDGEGIIRRGRVVYTFTTLLEIEAGRSVSGIIPEDGLEGFSRPVPVCLAIDCHALGETLAEGFLFVCRLVFLGQDFHDGQGLRFAHEAESAQVAQQEIIDAVDDGLRGQDLGGWCF